MRKLILQMHMSIDGFVCDPNNKQPFMNFDGGKEVQDYMDLSWAPMDLLLMGSGMSTEFNDYWLMKSQTAGDPLENWGKLFTNVPKRVFSKTLNANDPRTSKWQNVSFTDADLVQEVNQLKQQSGGEIWCFGGASFATSLVNNNLPDEYRLIIHPNAIGKGKSIFSGVENKKALKLVEGKVFGNGATVLKYVPK